MRLSLLLPGSSAFINDGLISKLWARFIEPTLGRSDVGKHQETNLLLTLRAVCSSFSKPECFDVINSQKNMVSRKERLNFFFFVLVLIFSTI